MTGISLPTLAGIARMTAIFGTAAPGNVGGGWTVVAYTTPAGRVGAIDWAQVLWRGGTTPSSFGVEVLSDTDALVARLVGVAPPVLNNSAVVTNTIWLPEGHQLRFGIGGGDSTTDIAWGFAGREFDWVDVT